MPKPIYNGAVGKADFGENGGAQVKARVSVKVSDRQSGSVFRQVNQNLGKNPNHARPAGQNNNPPAANNGNQTVAPQNQNQPANANQNAGGAAAAHQHLANTANNGANHAAEQGLINGRGLNKQTPPNQNQPNEAKNAANNGADNAPQTYANINPQAHQTGQNHPPVDNRQNHPFLQNHQPNQNINPANQPNQTPGHPLAATVRQVVALILRQNDVYVSAGGENKFFNQNFQTNGQARAAANSHDLNNLIQNIGSRVLALLDNSQQVNGRIVRQVAEQVSHQFRQQIETAKTSLLQNADLGAKTFKHLNIAERMQAAVELLPLHLPASELAESLRNYQPRETLNGLLLARGLIAAQENTADLRNLIAHQPKVLPGEISLAALRDVGQLVKILIADAAAAKSTANLDQAVRKFVRLLIANNELGVLLASISLASQTRYSGGLISRSLALAQIYELISRLIVAGEKAMKDAAMPAAMDKSAKTLVQTAKSDFSPLGVSNAADREETLLQPGKPQIAGAESALRQFLEFNPAFAFDNSASAFNNSDDALDAQKSFVSLYRDDIDNWLMSGNHRFVKDFELEKPVGVVIERGNERLFTSSTIRIVLVRDGSVQGWHFLKSFLIK